MNRLRKGLIVAAMTLATAAGLWAQRPGGMGSMFGNMPTMPGLSNPTPGAGSEYTITSKGKDMDMAIVTLGKEDVDGGAGYWLEMRMNSPETNGEMVMKQLMVPTGPQPGIKRMIIQAAGRPPMEMDPMMMNMFQQRGGHPMVSGGGGENGGRGELIGTESVTVPAGTFNCQHYRSSNATGTTDVWISTDVTPYAMVKMTSSDTTMVLKKVLTDEKSHIVGEPQKMQMPHF
jgi:hypothetical protein